MKKKIIILLKSAFLPLQMVLNIFLVLKIVCKYIFHQPYFPLSLPFLQVNILTIYNEQKSCFTCALFIEKKKIGAFLFSCRPYIFFSWYILDVSLTKHLKNCCTVYQSVIRWKTKILSFKFWFFQNC